MEIPKYNGWIYLNIYNYEETNTFKAIDVLTDVKDVMFYESIKDSCFDTLF